MVTWEIQEAKRILREGDDYDNGIRAPYHLYLVEWRRYRCVSQRDLSHRSGVAPATIVEIEAGRRNPHTMTIRRLAFALEAEPHELYANPFFA